MLTVGLIYWQLQYFFASLFGQVLELAQWLIFLLLYIQGTSNYWQRLIHMVFLLYNWNKVIHYSYLLILGIWFVGWVRSWLDWVITQMVVNVRSLTDYLQNTRWTCLSLFSSTMTKILGVAFSLTGNSEIVCCISCYMILVKVVDF